MTQAESRLSFSPLATMRYLVVGVALAALGWALMRSEMALLWILGGGMLLTGPGIVIAVLLRGVRSAPCPRCGTPVESILNNLSGICCEACTEYLEASDGRLRMMDDAAIAAEPTFKLRMSWWDDLRTPTLGTITLGGPQDFVQDRLQELLLTKRIPDRTMPAVWPGGCCVCSAPPTRCESIAQEVNAGVSGKAGLREQRLMVHYRGIPHCDGHEKGVKLSSSSGECGRVLIFRSLAYRNAVRRANSLEPSVENGVVTPPPPRPGFVVPGEEDLYQRGEMIMSARVCGPLLLVPVLYRIFMGGPVASGWGLLWPAIGIGLVLFGYLTPLPKLQRRAGAKAGPRLSAG